MCRFPNDRRLCLAAVAVMMLLVVFSCVFVLARPVLRERAAAAAIRKEGGSVEYGGRRGRSG